MKTNQKTRRVLPLLAGAMFLVPAGAGASDVDERVYISPMANQIELDSDRGALDDGKGGTLGIGRAFGRWFNLEGRFYNYRTRPRAGGQDVDYLGAGVDGLLFFSRNRYLAPYFVLGGAYQLSEVGANETRNGVAQSGLGFQTHLGGSRISLRLDARYQVDFVDTPGPAPDEFQDMVYSIGLVIPIGASRAAPEPEPAVRETAPPPADHDGDGVPDDGDVCPTTPAGASVDSQGCELDSDGDGVVDSADECAGTESGAEVDQRGCTLPDVIELEGVEFPSGSDQLTGDARAVLDDVAETFRQNPGLVAVVAGHTDSVGDAEYNRRLSQFRAETVRDYLIARGVEPDQLVARGYGESEPVASNDTAEGRERNRRVELRIIKR